MRSIRLVALLGLLAAAATLSYETRVRAGSPIDLNGDWTISVEGDVTVTCTADVTQTGTDVHATFRCTGIPETELIGEVNQATRELSLGRGDSESLFAVDLTGVVSDDGQAVDGSWTWSDGDLTGTFHATQGLTPQSVPNIAGTWTIETGRASGCEGTFQQTEVNVQLDLQCPAVPAEQFTGQLDGRSVSLTAGNSEVAATFTADGLAVAGYWVIRDPCCDGGPFYGLRQVDHGFDGNATGNWAVSIESGILGSCNVAVEQTPPTQLFAAFDCGVAAGAWAYGTVDPQDGTFRLDGSLEPDRPDQLTIRGVLGPDGRSFSATYVLTLPRSGGAFAGILSGRQVDDTPSFIDTSGTYELHLTTQYREDVYCSLHVSQAHEAMSVPTRCVGVGDGALSGWLSPTTGKLKVEGSVGSVHFTLKGDATASQPHILEGTFTSDRRFVEGCFTTDPSSRCQLESLALPGDANCDRQADSRDATIALQVVAGILGLDDTCDDGEGLFNLRLQCCPVTISSLDAALILQISAGLLARLAG